jgi:hypothetical protein
MVQFIAVHLNAGHFLKANFKFVVPHLVGVQHVGCDSQPLPNITREANRETAVVAFWLGSRRCGGSCGFSTAKNDSGPLRFLPAGEAQMRAFPLEMWRHALMRHARQAPMDEFDYGPAAVSLVLAEMGSAQELDSR